MTKLSRSKFSRSKDDLSNIGLVASIRSKFWSGVPWSARLYCFLFRINFARIVAAKAMNATPITPETVPMIIVAQFADFLGTGFGRIVVFGATRVVGMTVALA